MGGDCERSRLGGSYCLVLGNHCGCSTDSLLSMKSTTTKRFCKVCHREKKLHLFYSTPKFTCKSCYKKTDAYQNQRDRYLRSKYGLTGLEYETLLRWGGYKCWICGGGSGSKNLAVDHNHRSGIIRGLLCKRCNGVLARMMDDVSLLREAVYYLEQNGGSVTDILGREVVVPDTPGEG